MLISILYIVMKKCKTVVFTHLSTAIRFNAVLSNTTTASAFRVRRFNVRIEL